VLLQPAPCFIDGQAVKARATRQSRIPHKDAKKAWKEIIAKGRKGERRGREKSVPAQDFLSFFLSLSRFRAFAMILFPLFLCALCVFARDSSSPSGMRFRWLMANSGGLTARPSGQAPAAKMLYRRADAAPLATVR
jgi:hypothetical protein